MLKAREKIAEHRVEMPTDQVEMPDDWVKTLNDWAEMPADRPVALKMGAICHFSVDGGRFITTITGAGKALALIRAGRSSFIEYVLLFSPSLNDIAQPECFLRLLSAGAMGFSKKK